MHHRNFNAILGIALSFPFTTSAQNNTTALEPVIVNEDRADEFSEGSGKYNTSASRSATGLRLSNQETPQAINVITSQQIRDQRIDTTKSALQNGIGISVERQDGPRYSISSRGHEINNYQFDGMQTNVKSDMGDLIGDSILYDRIEIVRGANSLMGGLGSPGASVNMVRKHANSDKRETSLDLGVGRYKERDASLDHTQPLSSDGKIRGRLILHHNRKNTFMDREKQENNTIYGIIDADITPKDTLSLGFSQENRELRESIWGGLPDFYDDGSAITWPRNANPTPKWSNWDSSSKVAFIESTNDINKDLTVSTKAGHRTTKSKPKLFYIGENSVTQEEGITGAPSGIGSYDYHHKQDYLQVQADGKFQAWQKTHEFMFGIAYSKTKIRELTFNAEDDGIASLEDYDIWAGDFPEPQWGTDSTYTTSTNDTKLSIFGSSRLRIDDNLALIMGGRLSNWKYQDSSDVGHSSIDFRKNGVWTPYTGITYDLTPHDTLYASYTDIFDHQTEKNINSELIGPSRGKSYELGWKGSYDSDNLQSQLSFFRSKQDNLAQDSGESIPGSSPPETAYYAIQGAKVKGFEVQVDGDITTAWKISAGYTQWKGEDAEGNAINTNTPRRQFTLFSTHDLSRHLSGLTIGAGIRWQGRTYMSVKHASSDKTLEYSQGSYSIVDLMANYQIDKRTSLQVNATNILDKKFTEMNVNQHLYGEPFILKASIRHRF